MLIEDLQAQLPPSTYLTLLQYTCVLNQVALAAAIIDYNVKVNTVMTNQAAVVTAMNAFLAAKVVDAGSGLTLSSPTLALQKVMNVADDLWQKTIGIAALAGAAVRRAYDSYNWSVVRYCKVYYAQNYPNATVGESIYPYPSGTVGLTNEVVGEVGSQVALGFKVKKAVLPNGTIPAATYKTQTEMQNAGVFGLFLGVTF